MSINGETEKYAFPIDKRYLTSRSADLIAITSLYLCIDKQKVLSYSYFPEKNVCICFA